MLLKFDKIDLKSVNDFACLITNVAQCCCCYRILLIRELLVNCLLFHFSAWFVLIASKRHTLSYAAVSILLQLYPESLYLALFLSLQIL